MKTNKSVKVTAIDGKDFPKWARPEYMNRASVMVNKRSFDCTEHVAVCVKRPTFFVDQAKSKKVKALGWTEKIFPAATVGRAWLHKNANDERDYKSGFVVCMVGSVQVNLKYLLMVERLFPGCSWAAPKNAADGPVQAIINGAVVAFVAGQSEGGGAIGEKVPA